MSLCEKVMVLCVIQNFALPNEDQGENRYRLKQKLQCARGRPKGDKSWAARVTQWSSSLGTTAHAVLAWPHVLQMGAPQLHSFTAPQLQATAFPGSRSISDCLTGACRKEKLRDHRVPHGEAGQAGSLLHAVAFCVNKSPTTVFSWAC